MKKEVLSDANVTFANALKWAEPLMKENPDYVIRRVLAIEPAVFGVAANVAKRTGEWVERRGGSPALAEYVFTRVCLASAIAIELMKKGNAMLFEDLTGDPEKKNKEDTK